MAWFPLKFVSQECATEGTKGRYRKSQDKGGPALGPHPGDGAVAEISLR